MGPTHPPNDSRAARLIGIRSIARRSTMARFSNEEVTSNRAIAAIAIAPLQSQVSDAAEPGKRQYLHVDLHRLGEQAVFCLIKIKPDRVVNPPTLVPTSQANETAQDTSFPRK
jgi:hypothetical protein